MCTTMNAVQSAQPILAGVYSYATQCYMHANTATTGQKIINAGIEAEN